MFSDLFKKSTNTADINKILQDDWDNKPHCNDCEHLRGSKGGLFCARSMSNVAIGNTSSLIYVEKNDSCHYLA